MTRKDTAFTVLGGFFLTNALLAEMIGGKIIDVGDPSWKLGFLGPFQMSVGIIPWPIVFVATDLINEYFGKRGVRQLTFLTAALIAYGYCILGVTMLFPSAEISPVDSDSYNTVFGQTQSIIIGSLTAFLLAQLVDVVVFHAVRRSTGKAMIWLRATGSTIISQAIDSIVVLYIGIAWPNDWTWSQFASTAVTNYSVKLVVAVLATPLVYLGHWGVERYLGKPLAETIAEEAAKDSE